MVAGCKRYDEAIWTEEVKLHDDRIVVVERRATRQPTGFPAAPRGRELEVELRYPPMGVVWKGDGTSQPLSFEIFDGMPHMVLYPLESTHCIGKPDDAWLARFLIWNGNEWVAADKRAFPVDVARMNLYLGYWGHGPNDDAKGLVTWAEKAKEEGFSVNAPKSVARWFAVGHTSALYRMYR
jgi:hypothetical protein